MNQIQKWIATIAGVTQADRARHEFSREFFGRKPLDTSALQKPACWRRPTPAFSARDRSPAATSGGMQIRTF